MRAQRTTILSRVEQARVDKEIYFRREAQEDKSEGKAISSGRTNSVTRGG